MKLECNDTRALTWEEVKEYAEDIVTIKGHDIALCDCGRFGYCALVFKNHAHLYCADQLHGDCRYYKELDNTVLAGKYLKALGLKWDQLSGEQQDIVLKELHRQEMACF